MKVNRTKALAILLAGAVLAGCSARGTQPESAPAPQSDPAQNSTPAAPKTEPAPRKLSYYTLPEHISPEWNAEGTAMVLREENALTWVGLDNEILKTVSFGGKVSAFSEEYALVLDPLARLLKREGNWTLAGAKLYDIDGKLINTYAEITPDELEAVTEPYQRIKTEDPPRYLYQIETYWLDGDFAVLNSGDLLLLWNIKENTFQLIEDYRQDRRLGYSIGDSGAYGVYLGWADGDRFYYMASIDRAPIDPPARPLFRVDTSGEKKRCLESTDYCSYLPVNGSLYAFNEWHGNPSDLENYEWGLEAYFTASEEKQPVLVAKDNFQGGVGSFPIDDTHYDYVTTQKEGTAVLPTFHRLNLKTGETAVFRPCDYDKRITENGENYFGLLCTRAEGGGVEFIYTAGVVVEDSYKTELWIYNTRESAPRRITAYGDYVTISGVNPQGTHAIEREKNTFRVIALE